MKALVYKSPRNVSVEKVPDAKIEHPMDVLVKREVSSDPPRIQFEDLNAHPLRRQLRLRMN